jgi:glycerol-3-phosphate dehydrogenase (NAD(P)+)
MNVTVIGSGSWGTALSMVLARAGHSVKLWAREHEIANNITQYHENHLYLPGVTLSDTIECYTDLKECVTGRDIIVFATPSHTVREVSLKVKPHLSGSEIIVSVSKGIENDTFLTTSQVLTETLSGIIIEDHIGVLYGPSHAEEVCQFKPTAVVSAAYSKSTAKIIQETFLTPMFRVYVNYDIIGVEIAGSLKNVMAIATGILDGAGMGDNAKAALMTRGLLEIKRFGTRLGASQETFMGLAGIGDLIVTCTSKHSRNRYVGYRIGQGEKLQDIIAHMNMVAEGVKTTKSIYDWSQELQVEMPISTHIYKVLFENYDTREAIYALMTRNPKDENVY